ncbi:MAG: LamG-like jellyroll fold domain-containing protein, partial [Myxococcota bacterium]
DGLYVTDLVSFTLNEPPTAPTVTLTPDPAYTNNILVASATGSEDPDGSGTVTYQYDWYEDGAPSTESASATFPSASTGKHHTYRIEVTPHDGDSAGAIGWAEVTILNSDPVLSGPTLSAATAMIGDVLSCAATATDIDPEDSPTITYAWSDGTTGDSYVVSTADAVDSSITCTATADDSDGGVVTASASATVTNTRPVVDTVTVTPATGKVGDVLTCSAIATDADGDIPTITYEWTDGTTGSSYTIDETDDPGDAITCTATATDSDGGSDSATDSATVENTDPVMGDVTISPDPAYNNDILICTATATDADGTDPDITYEWSTGETGSTLALTTATRPGDVITCTATSTDTSLATDSGDASITIGNRAPDAGTVSITPESPRLSDELICAVAGEMDPDGIDFETGLPVDGYEVTISYRWDIDGTPATSTGTTLSSGYGKGDVVTCTVTVTDESDATDSASASVTIENTRPNVSAILLTPSDLYTDDTLTAVPTVSDADGDELTITYAFSVNGDVVQDGELDSLGSFPLPEFFSKGDTVSVVVTADDGEGIDTRTSDTITVLNSAPTAPEVSITENIKTCKSVEFHGGSDELRVPSSDDWDFGDNDFTIEMWVKPNAGHRQALFAFENDYKLGMDFSYGGGCGGVSLGVNVWASSTGDGWNLLTADSGGGSAGCGRIPLTLGEWHHVAFVRDGNRWMSFVNGELDVDIIRPGSVVNREEELRIGSWGWDRVTHFDGAIDDFRVSSVPRYTADSIPPTAGYEADEYTLALWSFNDGEGTSSTDETSTHEASFGGSTSWIPDCPEGADTRYLVCSIDEESTDADGDAISYTFEWDVDGSPFTGTDTTTYDNDTIPGDALGSEETWTCEATPNDGEDDGEYASATYDILPTCVPSTEFYWLDGVSSDAGSYHPWMVADYGCGYGYDHRTATTDDEWCVAYYHDYAGGCSDKKWVVLDCSATSNGRICERSGTAGCSGSTFGGSCYSYQSHSGDWYDARSACEDWGGDLVSASSDAESSFVQSMLGGGHRRTWIGMINATGADECF